MESSSPPSSEYIVYHLYEKTLKHSVGAKAIFSLQSLSPALRNLWLLLVIITTENHYPSLLSYVPLDTVKHLRTLRSGAATRLIYYTNGEGHLSRLCCQVTMSFWQISETVAILKYTVGKLMPTF